jgi:hypothetical protein
MRSNRAMEVHVRGCCLQDREEKEESRRRRWVRGLRRDSLKEFDFIPKADFNPLPTE